MKKSEYLSTLFVGIDVSARANVICALNFEQDRLLEFAVANSQPGADQIADTLSSCWRMAILPGSLLL